MKTSSLQGIMGKCVLSCKRVSRRHDVRLPVGHKERSTSLRAKGLIRHNRSLNHVPCLVTEQVNADHSSRAKPFS